MGFEFTSACAVVPFVIFVAGCNENMSTEAPVFRNGANIEVTLEWPEGLVCSFDFNIVEVEARGRGRIHLRGTYELRVDRFFSPHIFGNVVEVRVQPKGAISYSFNNGANDAGLVVTIMKWNGEMGEGVWQISPRRGAAATGTAILTNCDEGCWTGSQLLRQGRRYWPCPRMGGQRWVTLNGLDRIAPGHSTRPSLQSPRNAVTLCSPFTPSSRRPGLHVAGRDVDADGTGDKGFQFRSSQPDLQGKGTGSGVFAW